MDIMQAFWLGLVQGLAEFLPISSSGHLLLLQRIFGISNDSVTLEVLLHMGTLLAVIVVYWRRLLNMILHPLQSELWLLVVATLPAVAAALLFDFSDAFAGEFLGFSFLITTLILWLSDLVAGVSFETKKVKWYNALVMGIMQAIAILPGVSRSGSTIAGGVSTGLSRKRAADFAFLMSVPAILGSLVLEIVSALKGEGGLATSLASGDALALAVGVITSAVFGFIAIKTMLKIVRRVRLTWFGLYTGVLGVLILVDQYLTHIYF